MNFTSTKGSVVEMREIPFLLLLVTAIFSLPPLAFSLTQIVRGTNADGKWFCLFFGLFIGWLFLEFVATRELIRVDLSTKTFFRVVKGVFRRREQFVNLTSIERIDLRIKKDSRGRKKQYLYLCGAGQEYLVNTPAKVYKDHRKTGRQLSEITQLPFA